ncbi:SDR family NAD(P)-dependent oxidoreductase [Candidatus Poribacteria bacterium]|nr:SDR family NAD(P)-dependent oxidoreductase [Candidatus Poribacteria bacterium]
MNKKAVALVTGASSGMGKEIAKHLLADGYIVYGSARRVEKMRDLEEKGANIIRMDITKEEDVANVVNTIQEQNEGVDILINNAGFATYGAVEDTTIDDARYQFEVNLFGLAGITKAVLPYMREQKRGKIANISSMGGKIYTPLGAWYHATKHALEAWSDCLRFEVSPFGIDVIIIEPGIIETEFADVMVDPMMERSGNTAYSELAEKIKAATLDSYKDGSPASEVAETVLKAVKAGKPKTRYAVGKMAKTFIFFRWLLGDRMFDRIVRNSID